MASDAVIVAGDINVHLHQPSDPTAVQLTALLASHGLTCRGHTPTHQLGGLLGRRRHPRRSIRPGRRSDRHHYLLRWSTPFVRPAPVYATTVRRPCRRINVDDLRRAAKRSVRVAERSASRSQSPSDVATWMNRRCAYRDLIRTKREAFWCSKAETARVRPRDLWLTFDRLLGRGRAPVAGTISASAFHTFFDGKVDAIREASAGATPPSFHSAPIDCQLSSFGAVATTDVMAATKRLPDKQCLSDLLPTWLFKLCAEELSPFLAHLFTRSFDIVTVPLT
jgi:hypothetical protein